MAAQPLGGLVAAGRLPLRRSEYADIIFGKGQALLESRPIVGVVAGEILQNRADRNGWLIFNLSASLITLGFSQQVLSGSGIILQPSGGFARMDILNDGVVVGWSVYAVGGAAGLGLYILESVNVEVTRPGA